MDGVEVVGRVSGGGDGGPGRRRQRLRGVYIGLLVFGLGGRGLRVCDRTVSASAGEGRKIFQHAVSAAYPTKGLHWTAEETLSSHCLRRESVRRLSDNDPNR